jgi:hypoxanthine phosphoribosyltransferase
MDNLKFSPLISEEQIAKEIKKMGKTITEKFKGKDLVVVGVLKGSFIFYADLVREIDTDITCEFCGVSSYQNSMSSSGEVKVTMDLSTSIKGRHVLLVEDIVDTGLTMNFLKGYLLGRDPKSLTTAALLLKPDALKVKCELDHVAFKIPNDFVVGYGLDYQGFFRNLPYIAQVQNIN